MKNNTLAKVVKATDETTNLDYIGKVGIITKQCTGSNHPDFAGVGQSRKDPFIYVRFADGTTEQFWTEELEQFTPPSDCSDPTQLIECSKCATRFFCGQADHDDDGPECYECGKIEGIQAIEFEKEKTQCRRSK